MILLGRQSDLIKLTGGYDVVSRVGRLLWLGCISYSVLIRSDWSVRLILPSGSLMNARLLRYAVSVGIDINNAGGVVPVFSRGTVIVCRVLSHVSDKQSPCPSTCVAHCPQIPNLLRTLAINVILRSVESDPWGVSAGPHVTTANNYHDFLPVARVARLTVNTGPWGGIDGTL